MIPALPLKVAEQGLCAQTGPDDYIWFPTKGGSPRAAKDLCAGCPVITECLAWAVTHCEHGIWGGTTEAERQAMRNPVRRKATGQYRHGTEHGYRRHKKAGEDPCDTCREAMRANWAAREVKKRALAKTDMAAAYTGRVSGRRAS